MNRLAVWSLAGKATLEVSRACLNRLLQRSCQPLELFVLSDGTLTDEDVAALEAPFLHVVRPDSDFEARIQALLAPFPEIREARQTVVTVKKLIDVPILATEVVTRGGSFHFIDSDILFVQAFDDLFPQSVDAVSFLESPDVGIHLYDILAVRQPLIPLVNTGIIQAPRPNLERAEEIFRQMHQTWKTKKRGTNPWLWEQTAYGYLYPYLPQYLVPRSSVYTPRFREDLLATRKRQVESQRMPAAYHLVRGQKQHLQELSEMLPAATAVRIGRVRVQPRSFMMAASLKFLNGARNRIFAPAASVK